VTPAMARPLAEVDNGAGMPTRAWITDMSQRFWAATAVTRWRCARRSIFWLHETRSRVCWR
jgi:hypothetical protein